jgi:hypothetical protein
VVKEKAKRKKHPQYDTARQLFVEANMDLKEIADILDVSATTLTKWNQDGNWSRERELFQTMPQKLSNRLQQMALRILELSAKDLNKISPKEAEAVALEISFLSRASDAISKISKSIVAINDRIDEGAAIQVMIRFDRHLVSEGALHLAQELKPYQNSFYKSLSHAL